MKVRLLLISMITSVIENNEVTQYAVDGTPLASRIFYTIADPKKSVVYDKTATRIATVYRTRKTVGSLTP
jgi:hypothetical protein